jgi:23S rRNA (pseudouridine1915-N3)-methyltransferase
MMKIKLLVVGSIKEAYLQAGIDEYRKRLTPFVKLELIEIKEEKLPDNPSEADIQNGLSCEGRRLMDKCDDAFVIALAIEGKSYTSEEFATLINDIAIYNSANIVFMIGGSYGLADSVKQAANLRLSFSKATFPHQLMRLIFFEQLYRAFMIINGRQYHK